MNSKKNRRTGYTVVIVLLLLLFVGFGYAAITTNLKITGKTTISTSSWNVHFENLEVTAGSVTATKAATATGNTTTIDFEVPFATPGDFYEFTVDVKNDGSLGAKVAATPTVTGITTAQDVYINSTVTYENGDAIEADDTLASGTTATYKVRVEYDKNITSDQLPTTTQTISLTFAVDYVQQ